MDYQKLISDVKDDIDNYSFDDSEYQKIYDRAYNDLKASYYAQSQALKQNYYGEKQRAAGENALSTRNATEQLAARGLAHSGESADLVIGQNVALNNRLSELAQSNTAAEAKLVDDYGKQRAELGKSMAQQVTEASKAEKENLYKRLEHLESLYADDQKLEAERQQWEAEMEAAEEKWQSQLDFDRYAFNTKLDADGQKLKAEMDAEENKWQSQLDADRYFFDSELAAEREQWEAEMEAAEEKWQSQLASDQYMHQASINADKEKWQAQLENDRYKFNTELNIEEKEDRKDRIYSWFSNVFGRLFGIGGGEKGDEADGLAPDVTIQSMANNLISRYDDKTGGLSEYTQDQVYSDFARLIATSDLDSQYATEVLAALRSKGFNKDFDIELASKDYVKEGYTLYNQTFDDYYEGMLSDGTPADDALTAATEAAENAVTEHIDAQNLDRNTRRQVLRMYGIGY
ncbi:MAG: hypothetical protein E7597_01445 [Ruminococcaceae bacterium]|nr:hypothetical protein [Oscillospiraceae bacterium]